jgi:hypothetical protein
MLRMLAFSLRWRGEREPGQLWSISLVELWNYKLHSQNHVHYQRGGSPSAVKKVRQTLRAGNATTSTGRPLQNSSSSKSFEHYENSNQYLNGHILGTYCHKFILSILIISILLVIQFILLQMMIMSSSERI